MPFFFLLLFLLSQEEKEAGSGAKPWLSFRRAGIIIKEHQHSGAEDDKIPHPAEGVRDLLEEEEAQHRREKDLGLSLIHI